MTGLATNPAATPTRRPKTHAAVATGTKLRESPAGPTSGKIAALMGAAKIEYAGTQNHSPSLQQLEDRFHAAFGYRFN